MRRMSVIQETVRERMKVVRETVTKHVNVDLSGKQRSFVILYVVSWIGAFGFSWAYWHEMNWILKSLVVVAEIFLLPDVEAIRSAFRKRPDA